MHREEFLIASDEVHGGDGSGKHRRFSLHAVIHFAVGVELINLGLSPVVAFRSAARFAYFGRYAEDNLPRQNRPPAFPFHYSNGKTLLVIPAGKADRAEVIAIPGESLRLSDVPEVEGGTLAFVAVDVGKVFSRALHALGMDPEAELRAVYGEGA
jgi:hypothetical protein